MSDSGLRVHERLGLGPTTCPICAAAPPLTPDSLTMTTLVLNGHPRCHHCTVLVGPGHAETHVADKCEWCATHDGAKTANHPPPLRAMRRRRGRDPEIRRLRTEGVKVGELAQRFEVSRTTVHRALRKNGRAA